MNQDIVRLGQQNDKIFCKDRIRTALKNEADLPIITLKNKHFIMVCKNKWGPQK